MQRKVTEKFVLIAVLFACTFGCAKARDQTSINTLADSHQKQVVKLAYSSIESIILNFLSDSSSLIDVSGLIILLGTIDSEESRALLTKLTNIYLGSAHSEALRYSITKQGERIIPMLESEISNSISCEYLPKTDIDRCKTRPERDRSIERFIEQIDRGITIDYVI